MSIRVFTVLFLIFLCSISCVQKSYKEYSSEEAKNHIGEKAIVFGEVSQVQIRSHRLVCIYIGGKYPDYSFIVFIPSRVITSLTKLEKLEGKTIRVEGKIQAYDGKPQIIVESKYQLKIVK